MTLIRGLGHDDSETGPKIRVRLVACGNLQPNQESDKDEIACETLNQETLRIVGGRSTTQNLSNALL